MPFNYFSKKKKKQDITRLQYTFAKLSSPTSRYFNSTRNFGAFPGQGSVEIARFPASPEDSHVPRIVAAPLAVASRRGGPAQKTLHNGLSLFAPGRVSAARRASGEVVCFHPG